MENERQKSLVKKRTYPQDNSLLNMNPQNIQVFNLSQRVSELSDKLGEFIQNNFESQQFTFQDKNEFENTLFKMREIFDHYQNNRRTLKRVLSNEVYMKKYHHSLEVNRKEDENSYKFLQQPQMKLNFNLGQGQCLTDRVLSSRYEYKRNI